MWVKLDIDNSFIANSHHSCGKLKCGNCLFQVCWLWPYICNHQCLAITSQRISENISKFGLSIGYMISTLITEGDYYLFEKTQTFIDKSSFFECNPTAASFLSSLATSQVYQVKFTIEYFITRLHSRSAFNVDCEHSEILRMLCSTSALKPFYSYLPRIANSMHLPLNCKLSWTSS